MIRTGGFPEKPVFREKKQTTKKPKSLWLLGSVELIPNWYWYIGIDIPFPLIPSLFSQAKQDFASFAQCGLANAVVASDSHIACPTLFLAFLSRWRWDEDMIFQKDMIFTLSDDLDESCEEQSSLAPHQSCHLDEKYENFKKKEWDSFLCAGQVLCKMSILIHRMMDLHMLSNITCIQVTIVSNLFLSVKYELFVPWQIHWATLKQQFKTKIRTEKNKLGTSLHLYFNTLWHCVLIFIYRLNYSEILIMKKRYKIKMWQYLGIISKNSLNFKNIFSSS